MKLLERTVLILMLITASIGTSFGQSQPVEAAYLSVKSMVASTRSNPVPYYQNDYKVQASFVITELTEVQNIHIELKKDGLSNTTLTIPLDPVNPSNFNGYKRIDNTVYLDFGVFQGKSTFEFSVSLEDQNNSISPVVTSQIN